MTKAELESVAEGWIRYQLAAEGSAEQAANWDFVSTAFDIRAGDPNLLWQLILAIHSRDQSNDVQCVLSAGPLEDLLKYHGRAFIHAVEQLANDDPAFARLLRGVYRSSMNDDVWSRAKIIADRSSWTVLWCSGSSGRLPMSDRKRQTLLREVEGDGIQNGRLC